MKTVLVVEDESMIAMMVEDAFLSAGWRVELAMTLADGLERARKSAIALGVLDVNLGAGVTSYEIADELISRAVPVIFTTGYGNAGIEKRFHERPILRKPFQVPELLRVAEQETRNAPP